MKRELFLKMSSFAHQTLLSHHAHLPQERPPRPTRRASFKFSQIILPPPSLERVLSLIRMLVRSSSLFMKVHSMFHVKTSAVPPTERECLVVEEGLVRALSINGEKKVNEIFFRSRTAPLTIGTSPLKTEF